MADLSHLKSLMGSAYHENVTVEEINSFLANGNYVNLKDGGYVAKDKFDRIEKEKADLKAQFDDLSTKTKDYDTLKAENDKFKGEKADAELNEKLVKYGLKKESLKYVKGDITDKSLTIGDDDKENEKAVKEYLKVHPEFASQPAKPQVQFLKTGFNDKIGDGKPNNDQTINDILRGAVGVETKS